MFVCVCVFVCLPQPEKSALAICLSSFFDGSRTGKVIAVARMIFTIVFQDRVSRIC